MLFQVLKTVHVLGALLFLGVGLGSAFYKFQADRSGDPRVVAWCQRQIVLADWLFTVPSALLLPVTGFWMVWLLGLPVSMPWITWGIVGYVVAGALWLPAVWLQMKMRRLAEQALADETALPAAFHKARRAWIALGFPAFAVSALTVWFMVSKRGL